MDGGTGIKDRKAGDVVLRCREGGARALHSHLELRKFKIYKRKCYENVAWALGFCPLPSVPLPSSSCPVPLASLSLSSALMPSLSPSPSPSPLPSDAQ